MDLLGTYWPWWLGALALATVALACLGIAGIPLGVSGHLSRLTGWKIEREHARLEEALCADSAALEAALRETTLRQFGEEALSSCGYPALDNSIHLPSKPPWYASLIFLGAIVLGGGLAALLRGSLRVDFRLDGDFVRLLGGGARGWTALGVGGLLVGFGTRMAGGCTSGHGLSGCARLQPSSLLATALFMGSAMALSFLLEWGLS